MMSESVEKGQTETIHNQTTHSGVESLLSAHSGVNTRPPDPQKHDKETGKQCIGCKINNPDDKNIYLISLLTNSPAVTDSACSVRYYNIATEFWLYY